MSHSVWYTCVSHDLSSGLSYTKIWLDKHCFHYLLSTPIWVKGQRGIFVGKCGGRLRQGRGRQSSGWLWLAVEVLPHSEKLSFSDLLYVLHIPPVIRALFSVFPPLIYGKFCSYQHPVLVTSPRREEERRRSRDF